MWRLYLQYEQNLRAAGVVDFEDVILHAEASLRERPLEGISAVVIDEAQDLSCVMLRMLHALVGDRPDGHDPRDQYVGHKRIDFPIVDPASTPMRKLRFVCLRALGDDPTAFVRSFAVHQKRVPWEAPRSKR